VTGATRWDPAVYSRYKTYRDRPALDLMVQIPADLAPREIWDLGCGAGEHAAVLACRHPEALVLGVDSSPHMLDEARARPARVTWIQDDIAGFAPRSRPDLIFTNAALQWLPDHQTLFPRLVQALAPGGVFACQMPISFDQPAHVLLRQTAADGPWASKLQDVRGVQPVASAADYYDWLAPLADIDIWSTTYLHVLEGPDPVVDWMSGTGLRPYLQRLPDPDEQSAFLAAYRQRLSQVFAVRGDDTTLFPFPRLFMVARRV
jgi:trans-aconitate 2-methyltransferase